MTELQERAVVLLSGGVDSATTLAVAISRGFEPWVLSFDYGQKAGFELKAAKAVSKSLGVDRHFFVKLPIEPLLESALVRREPLPAAEDIRRSFGIPETYVPGRNTIFLAIALGFAESIRAHHIFIGATAQDYSGYPDCRPEYFEKFNELVALITAEGVSGGRRTRIETPLMKLSKGQIISLGQSLGVDYSLTLSCYAPGPDGVPCMQCESCLIRQKGFQEIGAPDPVFSPPAGND